MTDKAPKLLGKAQNLKLAIDLRNRIIHGYDAVDDEIVYQTVTEDLLAPGQPSLARCRSYPVYLANAHPHVSKWCGSRQRISENQRREAA
jgi:hypothetical protein